MRPTRIDKAKRSRELSCTAQVTIRDEPTQEGGDINPESGEVTDRKRGLDSTPEGTRDAVGSVTSWNGAIG